MIALLLMLGCVLCQNDTSTEDERKDLMQEWEDHMADFLPDDMTAFDLAKGATEVIEEYISQPTNIRGAYFISVYSKEKIDFTLKDPDGLIISSRAQKKEAVFSVNVTKIGDYKFIFSNKRGKSEQLVTFAIDVHNATYEHLQHQDLDPVQKKIQHIYSGLNDILFETKFSQQRREGGLESLKGTHYKLLYFTLFETVMIIGVSVWQVYYIKKILDSRRLI